MNIEALFTTQIQSAGAAKSAAGGTAGLASSNFAFFDLILGRLIQSEETSASDKAAIKKILDDISGKNANNADIQASLMGLLKQQKSISESQSDGAFNLAQLLAINSNIKNEIKSMQDMNIFAYDPPAEIVQTLLLNQKALDSTFLPLADGVLTGQEIANNGPGIEKALLLQQDKDKAFGIDTLNALLQKLESMSGDTGASGIAITNMTPGQITALQEQLKSLLASSDAPSGIINNIKDAELTLSEIDTSKINPDLAKLLESIMTVTSLSLPAAQQDNILIGGEIIGKKESNIIASKLNAIDVGGALDSDGNNAPLPFFNSNEISEFDLENALNTKIEISGNGKKMPTINGTSDSIITTQTSKNNTASAAMGWLSSIPLPPVSSADDWSNYYDQTSIQGMGMTANSAADATSIMTRAPFAGGAHPATNAVAVAIQKYASDGVSKNFSLQLDPPELGRINVRLTFGKDKSVKAVVMAERPETVAMLQRDAHMLERALISSGLDPNSSSLSFELAGDGQFNNGGRENNSGGAATGSNDTQIIESTMTWFIDPETGLARYNILI
jgi:flagellar hook-length control protein FliK